MAILQTSYMASEVSTGMLDGLATKGVNVNKDLIVDSPVWQVTVQQQQGFFYHDDTHQVSLLTVSSRLFFPSGYQRVGASDISFCEQCDRKRWQQREVYFISEFIREVNTQNYL